MTMSTTRKTPRGQQLNSTEHCADEKDLVIARLREQQQFLIILLGVVFIGSVLF